MFDTIPAEKRLGFFDKQMQQKRQIQLKTCADVYDQLRAFKRVYKKAPKDGVEFQVEYIDTGLGLSKEVLEKAPIALALHGAPGSYHDFALLIQHLSRENVRVIAPNFPEYTATVKTKVLFRHSADEKAAYLRDFLRAINVTKIDLLVSHSSAIFPTLLILLNANNEAIAAAKEKRQQQQQQQEKNPQISQDKSVVKVELIDDGANDNKQKEEEKEGKKVESVNNSSTEKNKREETGGGRNNDDDNNQNDDDDDDDDTYDGDDNGDGDDDDDERFEDAKDEIIDANNNQNHTTTTTTTTNTKQQAVGLTKLGVGKRLFGGNKISGAAKSSKNRNTKSSTRKKQSKQDVVVKFEQPIEIKAVALLNPAGHRLPKSMKPTWFKCGSVRIYQHKLGRSLFRKLGPAFLTVVGVPVKVDNMDNVMLSATVMRNSRCQRVVKQLEQLSQMKLPTLLVFSENDKLIEKEIFYEMTQFMKLDPENFDIFNNDGDIELSRKFSLKYLGAPMLSSGSSSGDTATNGSSSYESLTCLSHRTYLSTQIIHTESLIDDWIRVMVFKAGGHYAYSNYAKTVNKAVSELLERVLKKKETTGTSEN